jgi:16S rRNA (guanine1207-N2)-methyltransferase
MTEVMDKSVALLLQKLSQQQGNWLLIADENWYSVDWTTVRDMDGKTPVVSSNRFDIAKAAETAGVDCTFDDFDFSSLAAATFDGLLFRISKERATNHHIFNCARHVLKPSAILYLGGEKRDGIKTYVKQISALFGNPTSTEKNGTVYTAAIKRLNLADKRLDDKQYTQLRSLQPVIDLPYYSKPGIFGWDKIDRGSDFLIEHLPIFLEYFKQSPQSLLDLGCGYGYLSLRASEFGFKRIVATDNCAAALLAAQKNLDSIEGIDCDVIPSDAGDQITESFDSILCNPPFHSGFTVDNALTTKFLHHSRQRLKPSGQALFVVNSFIPLEQKATLYFKHVKQLANNGAFKLLVLSN